MNDFVKNVVQRYATLSMMPVKGEYSKAWSIVVFASDYDWLRLDRDGHQKVADRAMDRADKAEIRVRELESALHFLGKAFELEDDTTDCGTTYRDCFTSKG